ncbi:hypothetical protein GEMRC1_001552 [Eukaryota sp. GEM-RC1]
MHKSFETFIRELYKASKKTNDEVMKLLPQDELEFPREISLRLMYLVAPETPTPPKTSILYLPLLKKRTQSLLKFHSASSLLPLLCRLKLIISI